MESRDDTLLKERLAALPLETPPAAAWTAIRARLEPATRKSRGVPQSTPWWLALAAGVIAVLVIPRWQPGDSPESLPAPTVAAADVSDLRQRSQQLENEIRGLRAASPALADVQYQWESAIEGDLALVDLGLTAGSGNETQLWRERVRLLEELRTASQIDTGPLLLQARLD